MKLLEKIRGFLREEEPELPPVPEAPVPLKKTCKQCGKTFTVMHFAEAHYSHVVYNTYVDYCHDIYKHLKQMQLQKSNCHEKKEVLDIRLILPYKVR